jgi:Tetratricopeptide repeat
MKFNLSRVKDSVVNGSIQRYCLILALTVSLGTVGSVLSFAQGGRTLLGDVKIRAAEQGPPPPKDITIIVYKEMGGEVARQTVSNGGSYIFNNLSSGDYEIAVEVDNREVGRVRLAMTSSLSNHPRGFKQDFEFEWNPISAPGSNRPGVISAADLYNRAPANQSLFQKAQNAAEHKKYDEAVTFLKEITENDKMDFQAWSLMGTLYLTQDKAGEAEKAYLSAIGARPTFTLALLNLGKLRGKQKRFADAVEPLTKAVEVQPENGEANFLLGEAYLQLKMGSKALPYLNEAARLGQLDAHLRLAWLYNAAGYKDRAALEYEQFLAKKKDYPDRKKLEEYVKANKKN